MAEVERTFSMGYIRIRDAIEDHHVGECESCDATDAEQPFCEGCGTCQECCNCTPSDCDCDVCEERRANEG